MLPEKIDSLADDVKSVVLELLRQNSGLTARVDELVAQNKALLARIAELEAEHGKPPKTPDNSRRSTTLVSIHVRPTSPPDSAGYDISALPVPLVRTPSHFFEAFLRPGTD